LNLGDNIPLFTPNGVRNNSTTNLINGATLPSDQSFVVLALRVFSWYRNSQLRVDGAPDTDELALNGDYGNLTPWLTGGDAVGTSAPGQTQDVYRLHYQTEEQLHWTFGTGEKPSISNMPTWYFPAGGGISGDMGGATKFIDFNVGETFKIGNDVTVKTAPLNHPNGATAYRLEAEGKALCYVTDTEHVPGKPDKKVTDLIKGADLVVYDSTYTDEEFPKKVGWGHSTWQEGVRLCKASGVKRLAIFHHDPDHTDEYMDRVDDDARHSWDKAFVAREGMVIPL